MSVVFGMVHSDWTVAVLLHKPFSSWLSTFCNSIIFFTNCTYAKMSELNIVAYVNNAFTFFQIGLLRLISLQYWLSFTGFSVGLH